MAQPIYTRTKRRYAIEVEFGSRTSYRNNIVTREVKAYSIPMALNEAMSDMCEIHYIRRGGIYPRRVTVLCKSWPLKRKKTDVSKSLRLIPRTRQPGAA